MPRMSPDLWEFEFCVIRIHAFDFLTSWSAMHQAEKTLPLYSQQVDLLHFHLERLATNLGCQKKRQIFHIIVSV